MDHRAVLDALNPYSDAFLADQLQAYRDMEQNIPDPAFRLSIHAAWPKMINERLLHLLEMRYGKSGSIRMVGGKCSFKYLFIEGTDFNLGIRAKKVADDWRSCNHGSMAQDELRRVGLFPEYAIPTYHLVLGYRESAGIEPTISHVGITWETEKRAEMIRLLWVADSGALPFKSQEIQTNLELPPQPKLRHRKDVDGGDTQEKKQG